jgi:hypothetical protein
LTDAKDMIGFFSAKTMRQSRGESAPRLVVRPRAWGLVVLLWLTMAAAGMVRWQRYEVRPGPAAQAPLRWPADSALRRQPGRPTLLVFAHPLCPCTRATLHELRILLARAQTPVTVRVLFLEPSHPPADWSRGDLWDLAAAIPGVEVAADPDGAQSRRFGAMTSGATVLYDASGTLLFAGGITAARGHEGDNAGVISLLGHLHGDVGAAAAVPVFGCSLQTPGEAVKNTCAGGTKP